MIYLDNNATTPIAPEVVEVMQPFLTEKYWNPSSMYDPSVELSKEIQAARKSIAQNLGARLASEIIVTSCATESNNAAIFGAVRAHPERRHLITSRVEHPAVLEVCKELQRQGYDITWIDVDRSGLPDVGQFVRALQPGKTLLVSMMHANNETGVIFPIERLARITKETDPQILFHTDATQSVTKLPIHLNENFKNIDMLSFSGHKIHAPKGIGVLYVKQGTPLRPYLFGGHQENSRRGGTENVPYIMGLAKAIDLAMATHAEDIVRIEQLRNELETELVRRIPWIEINGQGAPRMPNTLNVACHAVEGEAILMDMNHEKIFVSSGSACTSGSLDPSHVLVAMNVPSGALQGNIRFSLSRYTTEEEIRYTVERFPEVIRRIRHLSPFWDNENQRPK